MGAKSILILTLLACFLFGFSGQPVSPYPCPSTECLDRMVNPGNKSFRKDSVVVIYTFLACAPCRVLAKKMKEKYDLPHYHSRIIFLNNVNNDSLSINQYLLNQNLPFAYLGPAEKHLKA